jgi:hypothetical protein
MERLTNLLRAAISPRGSPPFSDGIKVWYDCPDATIDICFVHSLTRNGDSTTLLPAELTRARLLTWGYSVMSKNGLMDHANNLLIDLTNDRASCGASDRPLFFVAHGGGLVCKEAILSSRYNPEPRLCDVFKHTGGIICMGTPHRGSWIANKELLEWTNVRFLSMVRGQLESGGPDNGIAKKLLDKGEDVDDSDSDGFTTLIWASQGDHGNVIELLLAHLENVSGECFVRR